MVSGYAQKFKMAEPSDNPSSSSSEDDEYSDPLEVAASAGARLIKYSRKSQYCCYLTVCYWIVCYWTVCYRTV